MFLPKPTLHICRLYKLYRMTSTLPSIFAELESLNTISFVFSFMNQTVLNYRYCITADDLRRR